MSELKINGKNFPLYEYETLIVGSGAASLNCASHLYSFDHKDIAVVTEKLGGGTSKNTGSDKQTYYKLSLNGKEPDSPYDMAKSLYDGGGMHGDLALIEATMSAQEFYHLVQLGVDFPHDEYGGYVGYKTDHDPRQRATSAGPWTSSQMFDSLINDVKSKKIPIFNNFDVISLLVENDTIVGFIALDKNNINDQTFGLAFFRSKTVVFGVGGPGGLYKTSVYPKVHIGAIGLALEQGAAACNLTESQFGLASTKFRWNVSGTYQQVVPRYFSTDQNGDSPKDFLNEFFPNMRTLATDIFLKGYQWPFDPRKIPDYGSSLIDILVYIETVIKKRRVFMDFRENPRGNDRIGNFSFDILEKEAYDYLKNSDALLSTPFQRLQVMNPMAIELYKKNNIDLKTEPLEVAVCAQHNNGGLMGNIWWESNIRNLFPIGEVNGSHGVYRPGGSALNAGQVGSYRAAEYIAKAPPREYPSEDTFNRLAVVNGQAMLKVIKTVYSKNPKNSQSAKEYRDEFQQRMTNHGSHIRDYKYITKALENAYEQIGRFSEQTLSSLSELPVLFQNRHLVLAHAAYLDAIKTYLETGGGSRGSYIVMDPRGKIILDNLGKEWSYKPELSTLREKVLQTKMTKNGKFQSNWKLRRKIPQNESWFENIWKKFRKGGIYLSPNET